MRNLIGKDAKALATLEENARRILDSGDVKKRGDAKAVLAAIDAERIRRTQELLAQQRLDEEAIRERVVDMALYERAMSAFTAVPLAEWELEVLRAVADNPGADYHFLAAAVGKQGGGYINMAIGSLCSARKHYLGTVCEPRTEGGDEVFSDLIIDYTFHKKPEGGEWRGWCLKPPVEAALRALGVLRPEV